jgi:phospholipid/cholesterol/gamma-HCH transport system substrate-binding protein
LKRGKELLVGTVILVGLAIVVFGTLWLQGSSFGRPQTEVHALVRNVGQLAPGNTVKFRGVAIGTVGLITVEPDNDAVRLQLLLDGDVRLADDVRVVIAPESMFGDWQAELVTATQFPAFDFFVVPEGRVKDGIRVLGGYALPDLSRLTAVADEVADNLSSLTDRFDRAFSDETAGQLAQAIQNMEELTATLNRVVEEQGAEIGQITQQVRMSTEDISAVLTSVRSSMARVDTLIQSGDIDTIMANTKAITSNLVGVSGDITSAASSLEGTLMRADSAMTRLDRITATIESGEGTIGRLLYDATAAHEIETILQQMNLLLEDFRANPRKYVRLSIF